MHCHATARHCAVWTGSNAQVTRAVSVQRLKSALTVAEAQLLELRSTAESEEILRLAVEHYGWAIPWNRIGDEMKRDFRNHASVIAFRQFFVTTSQGMTDPTEMRQRLQIVGEKLVALREHLETCIKTTGFSSRIRSKARGSTTGAGRKAISFSPTPRKVIALVVRRPLLYFLGSFQSRFTACVLQSRSSGSRSIFASSIS